MGRFAVEFEVANNRDIALLEAGILKPDQVHRATIKGVVDCGAADLVLPKVVADELKLPKGRKVKVRYADRREALRNEVENVYVQIQNRHGIFNAIVEPKRETALIGAIVLESFDLLPDWKNQRLVPRDPRFKISEIETVD